MSGLAVGSIQEPRDCEHLAQPLERKEGNPLHAASYPADSRHVHPANIDFSSSPLQHGPTLWTDCLRGEPSLQADWKAHPIGFPPASPTRGCSASASELRCSSADLQHACLGNDRARPEAAAYPAEAHRPSRAAQLAVKAVALLFFTGFLLLFGGFHWYIHQAPPPGDPGHRGTPRRPARVPRAAAGVEFSPVYFADFTPAYLAAHASDYGELHSWEHLAAEHGSAAVVIIGDGDTRPRQIVDAPERPAPAASAAVWPPRYSALADAGAEDEEVPVLLSQAAFHWGNVQPVSESSSSKEEFSIGGDIGNSPAQEQLETGLELEAGSMLSQLGPAVQLRQPTFAELAGLTSKFGDASLAEDHITDRLQLDGVHALRQAAGLDTIDADKEVSFLCFSQLITLSHQSQSRLCAHLLELASRCKRSKRIILKQR